MGEKKEAIDAHTGMWSGEFIEPGGGDTISRLGTKPFEDIEMKLIASAPLAFAALCMMTSTACSATYGMVCNTEPNHIPYIAAYNRESSYGYIKETRSETVRGYHVDDISNNTRIHVLYVRMKRDDQRRTLYLAFDYSRKGNDVSALRIIDGMSDTQDKCQLISKPNQLAWVPSALPDHRSALELGAEKRRQNDRAKDEVIAQQNEELKLQRRELTILKQQLEETKNQNRRTTLSTLSDTAINKMLGATDLPFIHSEYKANKAGWKNEFEGKAFDAVLTFNIVTEEILGKGFTVSFMEKLKDRSPGVSCSEVPSSDFLLSKNWGDLVHIRGEISDHAFGAVILHNCQLSNADAN